MSNLLPIIDNVEFEHINGAEWYVIIGDVVCGKLFADHYDADGYAYDTVDLKGLNVEDLTWTVYNYTNEYIYIEPTVKELREAILNIYKIYKSEKDNVNMVFKGQTIAGNKEFN